MATPDNVIDITARRSSLAVRKALSNTLASNLKKILLSDTPNAIEDPFEGEYRAGKVSGAFQIIEPPFSFNTLSKIVYENSTVLQCILAMVTNVHGHGYRMEFVGEDGTQNDDEQVEELNNLEAFFDKPHYEETLTEIRHKIGMDAEIFGNWFMECVRDARGNVVQIGHVPAYSVRLTSRDDVETPITVELVRNGSPVKYKIGKRFRRFVQLYDGMKKQYFKEFGDPRRINKYTGLQDDTCPIEDTATEIAHGIEYNTLSYYGVPHWYTQLPSILGSRQAELTNLDFFNNNAIPAMAVLVSGGGLTQESVDAIEDQFNEVKGRDSIHKVLLLEARGSLEDANESGGVPQPTMDLKPLVNERQSDALFTKYDEAARDKIRSVFRLPPIFIGISSDYSYASAKTSFEVAESQIFAPSRVKFDDVINNKVLAGVSMPKYWRFRSNPPQLSTSDDKIAAVKTFSESGAITPNLAVQLLNELLNTDIPPYEQAWGDIPANILTQILNAYGGMDKVNYVRAIMDTILTGNMEQVQIQEVGTNGQIVNPSQVGGSKGQNSPSANENEDRDVEVNDSED